MGHYCKLFILVALFSKICADDAPVIQLATTKHALIDKKSITVSGLSSGAFMANIMHYVFSSIIKGGGIFAGGPFNIAYNISSRDFIPVYAFNVITSLLGRSEEDLEVDTKLLAKMGIIDPVSNLKNSKVYVYQGGVDPVNPAITGLSQKAVNIYKYFQAIVKFREIPFGTHCVPTDNYGSPCAIFNILDDGLNNCGLESIFEMFSHFYGKAYKKPASSSTKYTGNLYNFEQSPYTPSGNAATDFMNEHGGIYIPLACRDVNAKCKLHVAFHGCLQTIFTNIFYDKFAVHAGYLQVADKNNIIVVFPRTAPYEVQWGKANFGCWDWFGATTTSMVPFKEMSQVISVMNILNEIIGDKLFK